MGLEKKVIPATAALGILFSVAPIAENKASAGIGAVLDITITVLGAVANTYEALGITPDNPDPGTHIDVYAENETYQAPSFTSGEFNISMYHTYGDLNFLKPVKVRYPNGRIEIHQLKSGQQLKITEAGAIIDLNPNAENVSEHDLLYITQAQLDEGKTGVVMNQGQHAFVEKASGKNPRFLLPLYKKYANDPASDWTVIARSSDYLFDQIANKLSDKQKQLITLTSKPVSKDVLDNYVNNEPKARADFYDRLSDVLAERINILETSIELDFTKLNDGKPYQIIPYKKGTNKVLVKTDSKYLSGKEGNALQYSDSIGDDEVFELVQTENSSEGKSQFHLVNKNGVRLAGNYNGHAFQSHSGYISEISFPEKNNNEVHNWLKEWYPGKENVKQRYEKVEFKYEDESNNASPATAYDSSGNVIRNSWVNQGNDYYYADASGVLLKGWQDIEGNTYYFNPESNKMVTGNSSDIQIKDKYYNFKDSGELQRSAWNGTRYSDASGAYIQEGVQEIEGKIYYFKNCEVYKNDLRLEDQDVILHFSDKGVLESVSDLNGETLNRGITVTLGEKSVIFEADGSIRKTGISKVLLPGFDGPEQPAIRYYTLEDGPYYSGWKVIDGKSYHFKDGIHYTLDGHETIDGIKYYFNNDGQAALTGFKKVDGKIYYFDDKGVMKTGWQQIDDKYYYFESSGEAKIGWFSVGGGYHFPYYGYFTYYAKEDGSIYQNTSVEINGKTYKFDSHGHKGY
ncbi:N-acetylmuramoyl-L-alanine amidase family protein [Bacillus pseudomycoides]|uniref:N-acetylmuramoyl-L-alanine amidase family protein n=1 Tax=Bacillus pseudomycoides TaxID=64104 RepID=UPI001FB4C749|nr:cell wall-binding protein [Bacillus pseudomycoides]